ncbi:MAG TPA: SDR family oxidoreductase [Solirubrobacteraceae bacterium]|nr:SDR family oxidoreductase [Solirubrobacteraceae bacterium]
MAKTLRSLDGQVVAITGGGRGIGRATATALIAKGARVAIGDIDAPLAEKTASELGSGTIGLPLDVTDRASFAGFLDEVERQLGPLDVLVNNAGIMPVGPFIAETDASAERLVDINIHGVILGSKLAIERFTPRGRGHIVQLASIAGKGGFPGGATYCATKHAVVGLTEALRAELRGTGIELHQVLPIGVNTELYSGVSAARGFPTAEPVEVANTIVELLQTGKFELYVPRQVGAITRMQAMMPRRLAEAIIRWTKGDQLLLNADPTARAAYEARINGVPAGPVAVATEAEKDAA